MKRFLFIIALGLALQADAQEQVEAETISDEGAVEVIADQRIDRLINRRAEFHRIDSSAAGFRIQIFATTERQDIKLAKEQFEFKYPGVAIYMKYDSPNYKLRVGDFSTKLEAQYWFQKLREEYPTLFLVPDTVFP